MNTFRHEIDNCGRRIQCRNCIILHAFGHADTPSKVSPALSRHSCPAESFLGQHRIILVSNHLPIRATKREETGSWEFEWDEDALIYQAQVGCTS